MNRKPLQDALTEHQYVVGVLLDEAELLLRSVDPARAPMMMLVRLRLTKRLRSYQEFKHTLLFDPLCGNAVTAIERLAHDMRDRCNAIGDAYVGHVKAWPDEGLEDRWPLFKEAALRMVAAIRQHIAREKQDAEQLLWVRLWKA